MENLTAQEKEKSRIRVSILIPLFFVSTLWLVFFTEYAVRLDFSWLGILPRTLGGLSGIIFTPFLHGSFGHLLSNSVPLLLLGAGLIYFYRNISYKVLLWIWLMDGIGVWLLGRNAYHIGASGIVYGMASFLIFSGILRKNRNLLALSMTVIFIYGSLIWGMLPYVPDVSWEAHLFGFIAGIFFSIYYLKRGPSDDPVPDWMKEEMEAGQVIQAAAAENNDQQLSTDSNGIKRIGEVKEEEVKESGVIRYLYAEKDKAKDPKE